MPENGASSGELRGAAVTTRIWPFGGWASGLLGPRDHNSLQIQIEEAQPWLPTPLAISVSTAHLLRFNPNSRVSSKLLCLPLFSKLLLSIYYVPSFELRWQQCTRQILPALMVSPPPKRYPQSTFSTMKTEFRQHSSPAEVTWANAYGSKHFLCRETVDSDRLYICTRHIQPALPHPDLAGKSLPKQLSVASLDIHPGHL